jgi:two-component sensor histidine kinase
MNTGNLFRLYDNVPGWEEAETKIKEACEEAANKIRALQEQYEKVGANDTDARWAMAYYFSELVGPPR